MCVPVINDVVIRVHGYGPRDYVPRDLLVSFFTKESYSWYMSYYWQ